MALHLILGNSGAGKSHYLYEHILSEAGQHPERTYYVLVPEQFTMATQREFVRRQEKHAILNVDVLSFKRLAYRVFEELGKDTLQVLEDTGKNLILQKLAGDLEPKLTVLQGSLHRMGYIDEIKSFLTELAQYRIEPWTLSEMAAQADVSPLLSAKLSDIRLLYEAFLKEIDGDYLLAEEVVEYLARLVPDSELFSNAVLVFDGFTGFTPVQQTFLKAALPEVVDSYVHYLAVGVANMINIFFPEVVGLSGGVANQGENLLKLLRAAVEPMVFGHEFAKKHTRITTCTLGCRAGVIGAALPAKGQAAQQG